MFRTRDEERGSRLVDDEIVNALVAVAVLEYEPINAVLFQPFAGFIFDGFAVLRESNGSLVGPSEADVGIRVAAVLHAFEDAVGRGLLVIERRFDSVDSRSESVRKHDAVAPRGTEVIGQSIG